MRNKLRLPCNSYQTVIKQKQVEMRDILPRLRSRRLQAQWLRPEDMVSSSSTVRFGEPI